MSSVGDLSGDDEADGSVHVVDAFIGVIHKQFREDLFFCTEQDTVAALDTDDRSMWDMGYSALSTALAAYSS